MPATPTFTTPKTWAFQEGVESSELNVQMRDILNSMGPHLIVRRSTDQSVTSSTVLVDDNTLILPVLASEVWKAQWQLRIAGGATGNYKFAFTFPAGGELGVHFPYETSSGTIWVETRGFSTSPTSEWPVNVQAGGLVSLTVETLYVNGANAGNVRVQFAQDTSNATPTTHKTHSTLWAVNLA